jgi:hypothetical protein
VYKELNLCFQQIKVELVGFRLHFASKTSMSFPVQAPFNEALPAFCRNLKPQLRFTPAWLVL